MLVSRKMRIVGAVGVLLVAGLSVAAFLLFRGQDGPEPIVGLALIPKVARRLADVAAGPAGCSAAHCK